MSATVTSGTWSATHPHRRGPPLEAERGVGVHEDRAHRLGIGHEHHRAEQVPVPGQALRRAHDLRRAFCVHAELAGAGFAGAGPTPAGTPSVRSPAARCAPSSGEPLPEAFAPRGGGRRGRARARPRGRPRAGRPPAGSPGRNRAPGRPPGRGEARRQRVDPAERRRREGAVHPKPPGTSGRRRRRAAGWTAPCPPGGSSRAVHERDLIVTERAGHRGVP